MDAHPVPKNVLTVEFKLFGSLTIKQFTKILVGCALAFGVYLLNIHPLITYPVIIVTVIFALASALLPDFTARANGFFKALFVSPQYVWRKSGKTPEVLRDPIVSRVTDDQVAKAKLQAPVDYHDISIDKLLAARSFVQPSAPSDDDDLIGTPAENSNFNRVYGQLFANDAPAIPTTSVVKTGANTAVEIRSMRNNAPRPLSAAAAPVSSAVTMSSSDLHAKLASLQQQLQDLNKVNASAEQKQAVLDQINEIYQAAHSNYSRQPQVAALKPSNKITVYGVVVDKRDQPVLNAGVSLQDDKGKALSSVVMTSRDGKFAIEAMPTTGSYLVTIKHPTLKFPAYKIKSDGATMPAFKFRER